jgi:transposase
MLSSVNAVFPENHFIYQHSCPIHTARIISYWMEQEGIRVLPWPSRSPDLNPIENILGLMISKRRRVIGKKFKKCETNYIFFFCCILLQCSYLSTINMLFIKFTEGVN